MDEKRPMNEDGVNNLPKLYYLWSGIPVKERRGMTEKQLVLKKKNSHG